MKYNKGEWSEAYAFIKLIGEGKVFASDENLNKLSNKQYPIRKVFKDEIDKYYETNADEGLVNMVNYDGDIIDTFESSKFIDIADKSLDIISKSISEFSLSSPLATDPNNMIFSILSVFMVSANFLAMLILSFIRKNTP